MASVPTAQRYYCPMKAALNKLYMNERGGIPMKLCLQQQQWATHQIRLVSFSWVTPLQEGVWKRKDVASA